MTNPEALLRAVREFQPIVAAAQESFDSDRRLPDQLIRALNRAGVFRMTMPKKFGGLEVEPAVLLEVIETLSRFDGAVGWVAAIISGTGGYISGMLPESTVAALFEDPDALSCGTLAVPGGRAVATSGGYRVSGRWPFGSGCQHSAWFASACTVHDGDAPRCAADGTPEMRVVVLGAADCEILDTWDVAGLRGTGSHDYRANGVLVPESQTFVPGTPPIQSGPQFAARFFLLAHAAHAIGIARSALDAFITLAASKRDRRSGRLLRDASATQVVAAEAAGLVDTASALLTQVTAELWRTATAGKAISAAEQMRARLAIVSGVRYSLRAVDLLFEAAGTSSIYQSNPIERCFRDIHVAAQHGVVGRQSLEAAGRVLLGIEAVGPLL